MLKNRVSPHFAVLGPSARERSIREPYARPRFQKPGGSIRTVHARPLRSDRAEVPFQLRVSRSAGSPRRTTSLHLALAPRFSSATFTAEPWHPAPTQVSMVLRGLPMARRARGLHAAGRFGAIFLGQAPSKVQRGDRVWIKINQAKNLLQGSDGGSGPKLRTGRFDERSTCSAILPMNRRSMAVRS